MATRWDIAACTRKMAYPSRRDAVYCIRYMQELGRRIAYRLRYYRCPACGQYHLTKRPEQR